MNQHTFKSGKKVPKRPAKEGETLPQILKRLVDLLEKVDLIPHDDDPNNPHNWYGDKALYKKEFSKRYQNLKSQNPSKEDLLDRLTKAEMDIAYENYFNSLLIKPYIASKEAILQSHQHVAQSAAQRVKGIKQKYGSQHQSAISIIDQIKQSQGQIHQNDYGIYIIKTSKLNPPIPKPTARKYWLEETGFTSTKKLISLK